MNLTDALARYLVQLQANGRTKHTVDQARRHVLLLDTWLTGPSVRDALTILTTEDVACFLASDTVRLRADGQPRKTSSANALRSSLRAFCRFAFEAGLSPRNPAGLVRRARCGPSAPRAFSEREEARLRAALAGARTRADRRDAALFTLLLDLGLRISSALGLRIEDLDLESGELRICTNKAGGERAVEAPTSVVERLAELVAERRRGWVFKGQGGKPLATRHVQRRLQLWLDRAGVRRAFSPHSLRHSFATKLYRESRDLLYVRDSLGHASIQSTAVYAGTEVGALRCQKLSKSIPSSLLSLTSRASVVSI